MFNLESLYASEAYGEVERLGSGRVSIDWPVVTVSADREITYEFAQAVNRLMDKIFEQSATFGLIIDLRNASGMNAKTRSLLANFQHSRKREFGEFVAAEADIVDSALMSGILVAISWFSPSPHPLKTVATMKEARAWVGERLESAD